MGLSNLPPGVTESMIPGNRPEDVLWDRLVDEVCGSCDCESVCKHVADGSYEDCSALNARFEHEMEGPDPDRAYDEAHGK